MNRLRQLLQRFRSSFANPQADSELDAEMESHLAMAIEENMKRGMSEQEAWRQARLQFGGLEQAMQQQREARGLPALDILWQDLRFTLRSLRRDHGFAIVAVLILGLGIGANVAVFSVVNTILLRPLPFENSQELVWLEGNAGLGAMSDTTYRVDAYEAFKQKNKSFENVTAYVPFFSYSDYELTSQGEPKPVSGLWVTGDFFQTLGVQPVLGRHFASEENIKGGRPAILLSYAFWQRQFNADPAIVGQAITVNNTESLTVVGVLPASFDFGAVFAPGTKMDFFRPIILDNIRYYGHMLAMVGRLKPGITVAQAQAEASILFPQLRQNGNPAWSTDANTIMAGLKEHVSGKLRRSLIVLWCAVALILLIVCVNLSNLLLARAAARNKEFAMRSALGASRGRLIRQLLTESLILSSTGAILGLGFAAVTVFYLAHQGSLALPLLSTTRIDASAFLWTVLVAIAAGGLFGIAPSLRMARVNLQEALKDSGHGISDGRNHERMRSALVISEIALACVLLVGAGLLLRSFLRVLDVDLGFQPGQAAAIKIDYDDQGNADRRGAILKGMLDHVSALSGVEAAFLTICRLTAIAAGT